MKQAQTIKCGEALLLSLTIATQRWLAAESALNLAQVDRDKRLDDLCASRESVELAKEAICQFAAKAQITLEEVTPEHGTFYGQTHQSDEAPAIGTYWLGQGGIYGGILQYPDGLHHTIFGAEDLGNFAWGEHGTETGATQRVSGVLNTTTLRDTDGSFPAAEAASEYTADGRHDFYLPSIGELNHAMQNIPDAFDKDTWYWSSTQRSANNAFYMYFVDGTQLGNVKGSELRVRPARRLIIQ